LVFWRIVFVGFHALVMGYDGHIKGNHLLYELNAAHNCNVSIFFKKKKKKKKKLKFVKIQKVCLSYQYLTNFSNPSAFSKGLT
jgi:hypothetical protein